MSTNRSYIESVRKVYETLTFDELLHEYYGEKFYEPHITDEAKLVIEELFAKNNVSVEEAFWKHQALMEAESYLNEDKTSFPPPKVIGRHWFYKDWLKAVELSKEMGIDTKGIESIESYYDLRSIPLTLEQQAVIDKFDDELETLIHYGKYKSKK